MLTTLPDWVWHREGLGWCGLSAFTAQDLILGIVGVATYPDPNPTCSGGTRPDRVAEGGMGGWVSASFLDPNPTGSGGTRRVRVAAEGGGSYLCESTGCNPNPTGSGGSWFCPAAARGTGTYPRAGCVVYLDPTGSGDGFRLDRTVGGVFGGPSAVSLRVPAPLVSLFLRVCTRGGDRLFGSRLGQTLASDQKDPAVPDGLGAPKGLHPLEHA